MTFNRWLLVGLLFLGAAGAKAQITVPNTFVPGTTASAAQVNANFEALATSALNRTGGTITGSIVIDPGVTIDGIDISAILGNNQLKIGAGSFIRAEAPQLVYGWDNGHLGVLFTDNLGNGYFSLTEAGASFYFDHPVTFTTLTTTSLSCAGCIGAAQILDGSISAADIADGSLSGGDIANNSIAGADIQDGSIAPADLENTAVSPASYGSTTSVATFTVDSDGRLTAAGNAAIAFPAPPVIPPSYALGANQIPETAIIDGSLLARVGATETITGAWTFTTAPIFSGGLTLTFPADIRLYGAGEGGVIKQSSSCPTAPGLWLGSREGGADHLVLCLQDGLLSLYGQVLPNEDDRWTLGDATHRWKTIHLALAPSDATFPFVIVGNPAVPSSLSYYQGATKTCGSLPVVRAGLVVSC